MTYEKPQVEIVKFDAEGFMTASTGYASVDEYLGSMLDGWKNNNTHAAYSCPGYDGCNGYSYSVNGQTITFHKQGKNKWKIEIT